MFIRGRNYLLLQKEVGKERKGKISCLSGMGGKAKSTVYLAGEGRQHHLFIRQGMKGKITCLSGRGGKAESPVYSAKKKR